MIEWISPTQFFPSMHWELPIMQLSKNGKRMLLFTCSLVSCSLWPHGPQHARLPCHSPSPRSCSNSCPLSRWCRPTILSSVISFSSYIFPSINKVFSNESALHIMWPKYWSFSFSIGPSNKYSELICFRIDWLDLLAVQGTLKSFLQHHSSKPSVLWHSASLWSSSHIHT